MNWTIYQACIIVIFVITGSLNTILVKFADLEEAEGVDGVKRQYNHPFLQAYQMLIGMVFDYALFKILFYTFSMKTENLVNEHKLTAGNRKFNVLIFWLPAMCDMTSSSTTYVALNLTYASSYQMLRGAVIIFTALLSYSFFSRVPNLREKMGIVLVVIGLTIVGVSDYLDKVDSENSKDTLIIVIGDVMVVTAQFLTALQVILEEKFVVGKDIPPLQAVGWEGILGLATMSFVLIPLHFIYVGRPFANNSRGSLEDIVDAFVQMSNNWKILLATILTIFSVAVYNFCGLTVSKELNSTTRKVLDSFRVIVVWIVSMVSFGQRFQYIQLLGFMVLLLGMGFYNDMGCTTLKKRILSTFNKSAENVEQNEQTKND